MKLLPRVLGNLLNSIIVLWLFGLALAAMLVPMAAGYAYLYSSAECCGGPSNTTVSLIAGLIFWGEATTIVGGAMVIASVINGDISRLRLWLGARLTPCRGNSPKGIEQV